MRAFIDESGSVETPGHYVLAAVVLDESDEGELRHAVRPVAAKGKSHFHWRDESPALRTKMIAAIASLEMLHLVVAATPVARTRQERARAKCLEALMVELCPMGVRHVTFESRSGADTHDQRTMGGLRNRLVVPRELVFTFQPKGDPLLWVADAVAGAAMLHVTGSTSAYVERLGAGLTITTIGGV